MSHSRTSEPAYHVVFTRIVSVRYAGVQCVWLGDMVTTVNTSVNAEGIPGLAIQQPDSATADLVISVYSANRVSIRQPPFTAVIVSSCLFEY